MLCQNPIRTWRWINLAGWTCQKVIDSYITCKLPIINWFYVALSFVYCWSLYVLLWWAWVEYCNYMYVCVNNEQICIVCMKEANKDENISYVWIKSCKIWIHWAKQFWFSTFPERPCPIKFFSSDFSSAVYNNTRHLHFKFLISLLYTFVKSSLSFCSESVQFIMLFTFQRLQPRFLLLLVFLTPFYTLFFLF